MSYALFIDDERSPPEDGRHWRIARTEGEVAAILRVYGSAEFISFDHDLGAGEPTGYDIAHNLVNGDNGLMPGSAYAAGLPETFSFAVHSQNPVGAKNIDALLSRYLEFRREK